MRVKKSQVVLSGLVILVSLSEAPVARDVDMLTASSEQLARSEEAQKRDVRKATALVGRSSSVQEDDSSSLPPPPGPYSSEVTPVVSELEMTTFREPKPVFAPRPAYESAASHSRSESALRPFGPADSFGGPRTLLPPGQSRDSGAMPRARMSGREGNQAVGLPFPSTPRRSTASVDWHGPPPSYGRRDVPVPNPPMIGSVQNWPEYPRPRPSKVTQGPKLPDYYWYTPPHAVSQASGYGYRDGMGSTYPAPGYPHYPGTYNAPGGFFTPSTGSFEQSGYRVPGYSYPAPLPEYEVDMPPVHGSEGWWDAVSAGYAAPAMQFSPSEMGGYRSGPQRHYPYQWPAYDPAYATAGHQAGIQQNPLDRQQSTYPSYTEYGYGLVPGLEGYTHTQDSVSRYRGRAGSASPISTYHGYGGSPSTYLPASPRYGTPAGMQEHTIPISSLPDGPKAGVKGY
jgi:hypothetical protein